ncbi:MAG: aldo/keto reductase [Sphaerochaetaceae bacterium]|nr:aldo/keto reductase [Sphaerochaetaceae bacterium]
MKYRELGKDKIKVSQLGFGCMRFPIIGDDTKNVDVEKTRELLKVAVNNGVNYIDTAYPYHGGMSEGVVGKILNEENLRDKVFLTSKLSLWMVESANKLNDFLNDQLKRSKQDYFDFYIIHALNKKSWQTAKDYKALEFLTKAKKEGKIKYTGFSFHDESLDLFKEIVDSYDWDMVQIQYNYLDENYQAGKEGLEYCKSKGIGCVIMEPLKGGQLATKLPPTAENTFKQADKDASFASWSFKWLLNQDNVKVILSGMGALEEVLDNIKSASKYEVNSLSASDNNTIESVVKILNKGKHIDCTNCKYCLPCPQGVLIPNNFAYYNKYYNFDTDKNRKSVKNMYKSVFSDEEKASACVECGLCETHCPQHLEIRDLLKEVTNTLVDK